ncbi:MAG: glycosyltransferase, partial [Acidimicrobiales bacterium]
MRCRRRHPRRSRTTPTAARANRPDALPVRHQAQVPPVHDRTRQRARRGGSPVEPTAHPIAVRTANTISLLSRKTNKPTDRLHDFLTRPLSPAADVILAPSEGAARDLERYIRVEPDQLRVLPNPVVGPDLLAAARQPVDHPFFDTPERPVVLSVGRRVAQKDHATLLDAFARTRRHHDARLIVLGDGPLRQPLLSRCHELGLKPNIDVDFPGFDPNPFRYMAAARLFVLSSHFEGLPGVLIPHG